MKNEPFLMDIFISTISTFFYLDFYFFINGEKGEFVDILLFIGRVQILQLN